MNRADKNARERDWCKQFAELFGVYKESGKIRVVIESMCQIINDRKADADEREAALITLQEALFPKLPGKVGVVK